MKSKNVDVALTYTALLKNTFKDNSSLSCSQVIQVISDVVLKH
jgi:hypothetical protein